MNEEIIRFTLRTSKDMSQKFHYVASYSGRSSNFELQIIMKRHIAEFEKKHGPIVLEDDAK